MTIKPIRESLVAVAALVLLFSNYAHAEKADRDKPINLESDSMEMDDTHKISTYIGHVRISQGTLLITGDKVIIKQDANGDFEHGTAYGNPATFKQKREGFNEYIEGFAQRIEYDAKNDKLQLFTQARVKRGDDEVKGNYISYDSNTEYYQVLGGKEAATEYNPKGRVHAIIQPKKKNTAPAPKPPVPLKPADNMRIPDGN
jgi:lipopolysaccharide export system protein LptA